MMTAELVKTSIYSLLREEFPESELYLDMLPAGFERPSFFLEQMDITAKDINCNTLEEVSKLVVYSLSVWTTTATARRMPFR